MIQDVLRLLSDSSLAAIVTVAIGCLILGDIVRACLYIFDSAARGLDANARRSDPSSGSSEKPEIQ